MPLRCPPITQEVPSSWKTIQLDAQIVAASKLPWLGSAMLMFPAALPNDGLLDLMWTDANKISRQKAVSILSAVQTGNHYPDKMVRSKRAI